MPWPWVILVRIPRVVAGEAPAETKVEADVQAEGVDEAELDADAEAEVEEDAQAEAAAPDSEAEIEADAQAEEVDEAELDAGMEVEADAQAEGVDEAELDSEEEVEEDAQAEGDDEAELSSDEEDEADVEHRADFSIPVALPPRITVMTAAPTAHPVRNSPDMYPYVLGVGSGCILFNFGVKPFYGVCFAPQPWQSNLIMVHHFDCSGVEQGHPATATAERIPPRPSKYAAVDKIESIGFVSIGHGKSYIIAELMVHMGSERATLVYFNSVSNRWRQQTTQNPLPNDTNRDGEWGGWVPSGVVSFKEMLWWFDLSWGIISLDPFHDLDEPPLRFHRLPEGRVLPNTPLNIHDRRCIAESQGGLRYVEIIPEGEAATVSMWSWIPAVDGNDETIAWDMEYAMSFAEIWEHDSYKATGLPRKVPVLVLVSPSDANLVYFALEVEERLFSVNVPERRVVDFVDDFYELVTPWPAGSPHLSAPSCRYFLPWFLPLKVAQAVGMDPFAGSDGEQLQAEYDWLRRHKLIVEDESSEEETTLSVAMDPVPIRQAEAEGELAGKQTKRKAGGDTGSRHGPNEGKKPKRERKPNSKYSGPAWVP